MIKPTVLYDQVLAEQGERGMEYSEHVRVGSRLGLLPWSRERQSSQLNLQAERLIHEGDYDRALWHLTEAMKYIQRELDKDEMS